jgi:cytochrome c oxidase subunit II
MSDQKPAAVVEPLADAPLHVDKWEGLWIRVTLVMLAFFVAATTIAALAVNIQVPGVGGRIDPNNLDAAGSPFAEPGLRELAPGRYEVYIVAQAWVFNPATITVPQGADVTFYVTSRDIQHGFKVVETNINLMVLPGQISTLRHTFNTPGTFNIICHEYCGVAHHTMYGQIIVEPAGGEAPVEAHTGAAVN